MSKTPASSTEIPGLAGTCHPRGTGEPAEPADGTADGSPEEEKAAADAFAFILRSTANRPQTEAELVAKLAGRDVTDAAVTRALQRARAVGAVDDAAFAEAWVEDRGRRRGYGQRRLRQELRRRQVPEVIAEAALAPLDQRDELAVATDLARQRAQQLPASLQPEAVARRLVGFLARRGYPEGLARRAAITASGLDREWD